jgi:hypothetical protein
MGGSVAPKFTIVNAVYNFVNAVHKMLKICGWRSQFDFENFKRCIRSASLMVEVSEGDWHV